MSIPANAERAASPDAALMAYMSRTRCGCEDCLSDLLCDPMYWSDMCGLSFAEALHGARYHYDAESAEDAAP